MMHLIIGLALVVLGVWGLVYTLTYNGARGFDWPRGTRIALTAAIAILGTVFLMWGRG